MGGRGRWISEFKANLVYRVSYKTGRTTQKIPLSTKVKKKKVNKTKEKRKCVTIVLGFDVPML